MTPRDSVPTRLVARAFAKVNLSLEVGPPRGDGYHPYESWATSVAISDTLAFTLGQEVGVRRVEVDTDLEDTLVSRALEAAARAAGQGLSWDVRIEKRIPPGSGLGGGSADAAAALLAADRVVPIPGGPAALAGELGTDVPFCLSGGCARLHGRGELVDGADPLPPVGILVAVPPVHVSTAAVFGAFDDLPRGAPASHVVPPPTLSRVLPECSFRNDLEAAAIRVAPELREWKRVIEEIAGRPALMTGSGSGFVCLADRPAAFDHEVVSGLRARGVAAWVTVPAPVGVTFTPPGRRSGEPDAHRAVEPG